MDSAEFTEKLGNALTTVIDAFLKAHGDEVEKVDIVSHFYRGTIKIKVVEKKKERTKPRASGTNK